MVGKKHISALSFDVAGSAAANWNSAGRRNGCEITWRTMHFARRQGIFEQGARTSHFYQVRSGVVRTFALLNDGQRVIHGFHFASDFFGIERTERYRYSADALDETTVRAFRHEDLDGILEADADIGREFRSSLLLGHSRVQDRMLLLGLKTAADKVAAFLLAVAQRAAETNTPKLRIQRVDVADYLGLSRETVSRVLSGLPDYQKLGPPNPKNILSEVG